MRLKCSKAAFTERQAYIISSPQKAQTAALNMLNPCLLRTSYKRGRKVVLGILLCERTTQMTTILRRQMSIQKGTLVIVTSHYEALSYSVP